jgi:hypothetical protein
MSNLDAFIMAKKLSGAATVTFKQIEVASRFRFPGSKTIYQKRNDKGWYETDGVKFRTGVNTMVIRS